MNRVERLLKLVSEALDASGVPYAVIGGNAIAAWVATRDAGAVRATKDVDILLRRNDLDRAEKALETLGFLRAEFLGMPVFLDATDSLPSQGVHVVAANERVRPDSKCPAPDVTQVRRASEGFWVLELSALVAMKLDAYRRVDQVHIEDLLRTGLIDAEIAATLPVDLLDRLRHVRETMEWYAEPPEF